MTTIVLQLDERLRNTLSDLFFASTQTAQLTTSSEDALAVFRIEKEFSSVMAEDTQDLRHRAVQVEDVARLLRFAGWLLSYDTLERRPELSFFFASMTLQAQAQYSGFEALLRSYGVDRKLMSSAPPRSERKGRSPLPTETGLQQHRSEKVQQVQIQVNAGGAQLTSTTTESNWHITGWKRDS